jgi:hypothetical protein
MPDPEILLERVIAGGVVRWRVEIRDGSDPASVALLDPLTDADLAAPPGLPPLPPGARTWDGLRRALSRAGPAALDLATLQAVGQLLYRRVFGAPPVADRLRALVERLHRGKPASYRAP